MNRVIYTIIPVILFFLFNKNNTYGQEISAEVLINTNKIQSANKLVYDQFAEQLRESINSTKFTNITYTEKEKIPCKFIINLTKVETNNNIGEIIVQASRPVYGTDYITSIFVYRDKNINFKYDVGQLYFLDKNNIENNLLAILIYYCYMVIDMNLSSFAMGEGNTINSYIANIISQSNSKLDWQGWKQMDNNRVTLYNDLSNTDNKLFLNIWYTYHIKGLDLLSSNLEEGKNNILIAIEKLYKYNKEHFFSPLTTLFADSKLDEIINIFRYSNYSVRMKVYKLLGSVYPTYINKLEILKRDKTN